MSEFLIDSDGFKVWYDLRSETYNDKEYINYYIKFSNQKEFYVRPHRDDGPSIIAPDGLELYRIKGKLHREDGPAEFWHDGTMQFYIHGKLHNEDGPARVSPGGYVEWWLNGEIYSFGDWCEISKKSEEEINFLKLKYNI